MDDSVIHKKKRKKKRKSRRHNRAATLSLKKPKGEKGSAEVGKMEKDLFLAVQYGRELLGKYTILVQEKEELEVRESIMGTEKDDLILEIKSMKLMNEQLEDQLRDLRTNTFMDGFSGEELKKLRKEHETMKEDFERLNFRFDQLKKDLDYRNEKYAKLKSERDEMRIRIEMLENVLEKQDSDRKHEDDEEIQKLQEHLQREKRRKERELEIAQHKIQKLKDEQDRLRKEFDFRINIVQNNLAVQIQNSRLEMKKVKDKLLYKNNENLEYLEVHLERLMGRISYLESELKEKDRLLEIANQKTIQAEEKVEREKPVDEEFLLGWINHFLGWKRRGEKVTDFSKESFGDGWIFCELIHALQPKVLDIRDVIKGENNTGIAVEILKEKIGVNQLLDEDCEPASKIPHQVNEIYLRFKKLVDKKKSLFQKRVGEFRRFFDSMKQFKVRGEKEYQDLVAMKRQRSRNLVQLNMLYSGLIRFYQDNSNIKKFFRESDLNGKLFAFSKRLLEQRSKMGSSGDEDDNVSTQLKKYNDISNDYSMWSKETQSKFLEMGTEVAFSENTISADYEDDEKTLFEKNVQLKKNGEFVKKIWKYYSMVNFDTVDGDGVPFSKSDIELENDILIFSLKGIATKKIKEILKFSLDE